MSLGSGIRPRISLIDTDHRPEFSHTSLNLFRVFTVLFRVKRPLYGSCGDPLVTELSARCSPCFRLSAVRSPLRGLLVRRNPRLLVIWAIKAGLRLFYSREILTVNL